MGRLSYATLLLAGVLIVPMAARADCHHRRLDKVTDNGRSIQLDDGSEWQIAEIDQDEAAHWQQDATITACDTELINTEEHATAEARETKRGEFVPDSQ